jgi:hypothetical protein
LGVGAIYGMKSEPSLNRLGVCPDYLNNETDPIIELI